MHIYNVPEPLIILKPSFIIVDCCTKVQTGVRWTVVYSHSHQEWVCKHTLVVLLRITDTAASNGGYDSPY